MGSIRKPAVLRNMGVDMKDFDWEVYLLNHPDLVAKGIRTKNDACNHFKATGYWEKRSFQVPSSFNAERYMKFHSHLGLKSPRDAYIHFMKERRVSNGRPNHTAPLSHLSTADLSSPTPKPQWNRTTNHRLQSILFQTHRSNDHDGSFNRWL